MNICPVTLPMMLDARERRQMIQNRLLEEFKLPLVCLTMNIAGDIKDTPAISLAFSCGADAIRGSLGEPVHFETVEGATGREAFFVYASDAAAIKSKAVRIEEASDTGRLFDIDVLGENGEKLSRGAARACIVCGGPAAVCSRSRAHGLDQIREATFSVLTEFAASYLADTACRALYDEVHLTPKPGLVDENNTGAHDDMDIAMFERSASALHPYFKKAVCIGAEKAACFAGLHALGQAAEAAMFAETGGVNTHKGAIYSFLILLGAIGASLHRGGDVFIRASEIAKSDTRSRSIGTHGSRVFEKYGVPGARGEAENGFPSARRAYEIMKARTAHEALLTRLSEAADTNVLHRGGKEALAFLQTESRRILELSRDADQRIDALLELDRECIKRGISPGGCADMLAMALLLKKIDILLK